MYTRPQFELADYGMIRTPLLPMGTLLQWSQADNPVSFLHDAVKGALFQEALYIASPAFSGRAAAASKASQGVEEDMTLTLARYFSRAAYRATPYGMFAAVTHARVADKTVLEGLAAAPLRRHVTLDGMLEFQIEAWVMADATIRAHSRYRLNDTAYARDGELYYVDSVVETMRIRRVSTRVSLDVALEAVVKRAGRQGVPLATLVADIAAVIEVSPEEIQDYLNQLIDSHLLVADIGIALTGDQPFNRFVEDIARIVPDHAVTRIPAVLEALTAKLHGASEERAREYYEAAIDRLTEILPFEVDRTRAFQVDTYRDAALTLARDKATQLAEAASAFAVLQSRPSNAFDEYKTHFSARFEDKEIPFLLALDNEFGVPFPQAAPVSGALVDGLGRDVRTPTQIRPPNPVISQYWVQKVSAMPDRFAELVVEDADIAALEKAREGVPPLVDGVNLHFSPLPGKGQAWEKSYIHGVNGRTGVETLGRFCYMDPALSADVANTLAAQAAQSPDVIYAEIVHLPQQRMGNILARPNLREYELVFLGHSGVDAEHQITLDDVTIQLQNGQFILRSQRLKKRIIPRLTSAHNYGMGNLGIYQFLGMLQFQDQPYVGGFQWPASFDKVAYLPRVVYKDTIWSLALWRLDADDIKQLKKVQASAEELAAWVASHHLPRYVTLDQSDNVLPIDLHSALGIDLLLDEIGARTQVELIEALALNALADEPANEAVFHTEVMLPLTVKQAEKSTADKAADQASGKTKVFDRTIVEGVNLLPLGLDWSYYKLYTGALLADGILCKHIAPLLNEAQRRGDITQWFFIRYSDPDFHLRVRFESSDPLARARVQAEMAAALHTLRQARLCSKVLMDSYEQETGRYGGVHGLPICEALFALDTSLIYSILQEMTEEDRQHRWLCVLVAMHFWLECFGLAGDKVADAGLAYCRQRAEGYFKEFGWGPKQKVTLGTKYRGYRREIEAVFFGKGEQPAIVTAWKTRLDAARPRIVDMLATLASNISTAPGAPAMPDIASSILHMHCNRFFDVDGRVQEAIVYDFLGRIYLAKGARK
ncbi:MAG: lantibiotic dehydratase [Betaproteobacteria bacterium]|nr:lantibiotic dehydratase [Betaproteobacteria bacterium]